ncbi:MAG TPA: hypothetical protein VLA34_09825, partial [Candidatus Krumholzibacterium sp.]|nr:hypothetical protein [Candidatus Krumholzibacterium sp.]
MNKTLVLGLARSGLAAVRLLASRGVEVLAADENPGFDIPAGLSGISTHLGEARLSLLDGVGTMVISPGVPMRHPLVLDAESRGIEVISELELAFRFAKAPVIAVTGTNGKSTTVSMIGAIMEKAGRKVIVAGN